MGRDNGGMRRCSGLVGAAAVVALLWAAQAQGAPGALVLDAEGGLVAVGEPGIATGSFRLRSVTRGGRERAHVRIDAEALDVTRTEAGGLPEFRAVLLPPDDGASVDLGPLRVNRRGEARLRLRDASDRLPAAAPTLRAFAEGTIEVRRAGVTVLSGVVPTPSYEGAGNTVAGSRVHGKLDALNQPYGGDFLLRTEEHTGGEVRNRVSVVSSRIAPATYRVYLVSAGRTRRVQLGVMALDTSFGAQFHADSRAGTLVGGIARLSEFDDGFVEVDRDPIPGFGTTRVMQGTIPPFRDADQPGLDMRIAVARGVEELIPTPDGGVARGVVHARLRSGPDGRSQRLRVRAVGLPASGGPLEVVAVHPGGTRTSLGTLEPAGPAGEAGLTLRSGGGRRFPAPGLPWLGGQELEVVDRLGRLVLRGRIPG